MKKILTLISIVMMSMAVYAQQAEAPKWAEGVRKKANEWAQSLELQDKAKEQRVSDAIYNHLYAITDWHNTHPADAVPQGINPRTGERLRPIDRMIIADSAQPKEYHTTLMEALRADLTEEQVEAILDKYTIGKVDFTMKGYEAIVPDMTEEERAVCLKNLKEAREVAIDFKNMKEISEIIAIAKDKNELYFNTHGRNWHQMYGDYVRKINAEKAAKKAAEEEAKKAAEAKTPAKKQVQKKAKK